MDIKQLNKVHVNDTVTVNECNTSNNYEIKIKTINTFDDIPFDKFDQSDLVAFDLDDTLFVEVPKIMRSVNYEMREKFIDTVRSKKGDAFVSYIYDNISYQLIEKSILQKLCLSNVKSFGFTARRTGKASIDQSIPCEIITLNILESMAIKFSSIFIDVTFDEMNQTNPKFKQYLIDPRLRPFDFPGSVMMINQTLFCNNIDKGLVLKTIFDRFNFVPKTFILIDDKLENLKSVEKSIYELDLGIKFLGYHYTKSLDLDNYIDQQEFNKQIEYLSNSNETDKSEIFKNFMTIDE